MATSKQKSGGRPGKPGGNFQSLKGLAKKKMKLPENGIW